MLRQHDFGHIAGRAAPAPVRFAEIEPRLDVEIIGTGAVLEIEIDQTGLGLAARAAGSGAAIAVCTRVVTPAPPTAGRKVEDLASVVSEVPGALATRAQPHRSIWRTGLTRNRPPASASGAGERFPRRLASPRYRRPSTDARHQAFERHQLRLVAAVDIGPRPRLKPANALSPHRSVFLVTSSRDLRICAERWCEPAPRIRHRGQYTHFSASGSCGRPACIRDSRSTEKHCLVGHRSGYGAPLPVAHCRALIVPATGIARDRWRVAESARRIEIGRLRDLVLVALDRALHFARH